MTNSVSEGFGIPPVSQATVPRDPPIPTVRHG